MLKQFLKQFPFIYPLCFWETKKYIKYTISKTYNYNKTRTHRYFLLKKSETVNCIPPTKLNKTKNASFVSNFLYNTSEKYLFYLNNCFISGSNGTVLTRENILLTDLSHNFNISSLKKKVLKRPFKTFSTKIETINGVCISLLIPTSNNYYHFIFDILLRFQYYERVLKIADFYLIDERLEEKYINIISELFSIPIDNFFRVNDNKKYSIQHLYVSSLTGSEGRLVLEDTSYLRRILNVPTDTPQTTKKIYIKRGNSFSRKITNEIEIIDLLKKFDFEIVDTGQMKINEQLALVSQAKIIISAHGAALTNIIAMRPSSKVIELFSKEYFRTDCYYTLSSLLSIEYYYWLGEKQKNWGDISINIDFFKIELSNLLNETA